MTRRFGSGQPLRAQSISELLDLGYMGLQLGYADQAEAYFDEVLARVPDHPRALLGKAKSCADPKVALEAVRRFLAVRPASREARQLESDLAALVQEDDEAEAIYSPVITTVTTGSVLTSADGGTEVTLSLAPSHAAPPERPATPPPPSPEREPASQPAPSDETVATLGQVLRSLLVRNLVTIVIGLFIILVGLGTYLGVTFLTSREVAPVGTPAQAEHLVFGQEPAAKEAANEQVSVVPTAVVDALGRAARATAMLTVPSVDGTLYQGSGVVITADGLVLTNYHVMTGGDDTLANPEGQVFVGLTNDERKPPSEWYIATAVVLDEDRDLTILRITHTAEGMPLRGDHFRPIEQSTSEQLRLGQSIMGLGYPALGGDTLTLTRGSMAGYLYSDGVQWGKTDSELLPGSSGGAVLDDHGRLIGVITLVQADESTKGRLSYFVLLHEAQELIDSAMRAPRPNLDVSGMIVRYATMRDSMP